jgi:putative Holliday junction resolvase
LAVTDPLRIIANALETVETKQLEKYLADYFSKNDVDVIVLGKPSQMNGQPSETMRYIEPLAGRLRHAYPDKQVVSYDERFTSVLAQRTIRESGIGKMARRDKSLVDKVSAAIILQDYMASVGM